MSLLILILLKGMAAAAPANLYFPDEDVAALFEENDGLLAAAAPLPGENGLPLDEDGPVADAQFAHLTQAEQWNAWQPLPPEIQIGHELGHGNGAVRDPMVQALLPLLTEIKTPDVHHNVPGRSLSNVIDNWKRAHAQRDPLSARPQLLCLPYEHRGRDGIADYQQHLFEVIPEEVSCLRLSRGLTLSPLFAQRSLLQALHLKHPCVTLLPQLRVLDWNYTRLAQGDQSQNQPQKRVQRIDLSGFHSLAILNMYMTGGLQGSRLVLPKGLRMVRIVCSRACPTFPHIDMDADSVHQLVLKNVVWNMPVALPHCQYLELGHCPHIKHIRAPLCEGIKVHECDALEQIHEPLTQLVALEVNSCFKLHRIPRGMAPGYRCLKLINLHISDLPDQSYLHPVAGVMVLFRPGPFPWVADPMLIEHIMRMWRWCIDVDECDIDVMLEEEPESIDGDLIMVEDMPDSMLRRIAMRTLRGCNYPAFATKIQRAWRYARYKYGTMPTLLACTPLASSVAEFVVSEYVGAPRYMSCQDAMAVAMSRRPVSLTDSTLSAHNDADAPTSKRARL
jgi:hypothetical protein